MQSAELVRALWKQQLRAGANSQPYRLCNISVFVVRGVIT